MTDTYPKLRWTRNRYSGAYETIGGYRITGGSDVLWKLHRRGELLATAHTLAEAKAYANRLEGR